MSGPQHGAELTALTILNHGLKQTTPPSTILAASARRPVRPAPRFQSQRSDMHLRHPTQMAVATAPRIGPVYGSLRFETQMTTWDAATLTTRFTPTLNPRIRTSD